MDDLKVILYGRSIEVKLADDKTYIMREPCIDDLETLNLKNADLEDISTIKKVAWVLLKDNQGLSKDTFGRLITFSIMMESSEFMKSFKIVFGQKETDSKNV